METGTPAVASGPETSQAELNAATEAKNRAEIVKMLTSIQYLLTVCQYQGKDAELVAEARQFVIGFKAHLAEPKK